MGYPIREVNNTGDLAIKQRRADLDWLRVIAFWLLIYYHAAIAFMPGGIPMIQNAETSPVLLVMAGFLHEFRLALLFLISGVGVSFALRHRNKAQFMRDRAVRLLVPLVFAGAVMVGYRRLRVQRAFGVAGALVGLVAGAAGRSDASQFRHRRGAGPRHGPAPTDRPVGNRQGQIR